MYTPTRIAGHEAVFEFLRHKLRAYPFIYIDIAEYRIDLFYVYGIDKIASATFKNFGLFVLLGPIGCTNIS